MKRVRSSVDISGVIAVKIGGDRFALDDLYYSIVSMSWVSFMLLVLAIFVIGNLLFASLYYLSPPLEEVRVRSFSEAFFASVGSSPVGAPGGFYGSVVATIAIFVKTFLTAMVTGGFFARFSRPRARLVFSEKAIIGPYAGGRAFMIRVASRRLKGIGEARARMNYLRDESFGDRQVIRYAELKLAQDHIPLLGLSWTLVHPIDPESPFWGMDEKRIAQEAPTIMASVSGFDEAIGASVSDRHSYRRHEILMGRLFADIVTEVSPDLIEVDITRIHETQPASAPEMSGPSQG